MGARRCNDENTKVMSFIVDIKRDSRRCSSSSSALSSLSVRARRLPKVFANSERNMAVEVSRHTFVYLLHACTKCTIASETKLPASLSMSAASGRVIYGVVVGRMSGGVCGQQSAPVEKSATTGRRCASNSDIQRARILKNGYHTHTRSTFGGGGEKNRVIMEMRSESGMTNDWSNHRHIPLPSSCQLAAACCSSSSELYP